VSTHARAEGCDVSLIIPAFNEEASIADTVEEADGVLRSLGVTYEIVVVDDGSSDGTGREINTLATRLAAVRAFSIRPNAGQSAAFGTGFRQCCGRVVVLMDGDGQNDPHDIPQLLDKLPAYDVCCGYRAVRKDSFTKRIGGRVSNAIRQGLLHDGIRDTGCSLKAIKHSFVMDLPMTLRGMHRFFPALLAMQGATIVEVAVNHRPRRAGVSHYTNWGRLRDTVGDVWAVRWMQRRYGRFAVTEEETA
jgi:dolichol-phosphate mannosyltransferase